MHPRLECLNVDLVLHGFTLEHCFRVDHRPRGAPPRRQRRAVAAAGPPGEESSGGDEKREFLLSHLPSVWRRPVMRYPAVYPCFFLSWAARPLPVFLCSLSARGIGPGTMRFFGEACLQAHYRFLPSAPVMSFGRTERLSSPLPDYVTGPERMADQRPGAECGFTPHPLAGPTASGLGRRAVDVIGGRNARTLDWWEDTAQQRRRPDEAPGGLLGRDTARSRGRQARQAERRACG